MSTLQRYLDLFAKLNRAPGKIWGESTKFRAPHKPFLLLAAMDLVRRGTVNSDFLDITGDLDELSGLFTDYWYRVLPAAQSSSIALPFFHLQSEPFWKLVLVPALQGKANLLPSSVATVKKLREVALGARIDRNLFTLMQASSSREQLVNQLLRSCFSDAAQEALSETHVVHEEAFQYSLFLESRARSKKVSDGATKESYRDAARNQGFRRIIIRSYDNRCALCGIRILTPEGRSAVDAAHIVPWSESRNDEIGNGMALCKLCHWTFDEGLISVSQSFTVLLSSNLGRHPNAAGLLGTLAGRGIIGPADQLLWPNRENLHRHRSHWGFNG